MHGKSLKLLACDEIGELVGTRCNGIGRYNYITSFLITFLLKRNSFQVQCLILRGDLVEIDGESSHPLLTDAVSKDSLCPQVRKNVWFTLELYDYFGLR